MNDALAERAAPPRSALRLSVAIGSIQPWPATKPVLDSVYQQALEATAEVVLAVRGPAGRPPVNEYPRVRVVEVTGASVFELRERAIAAASGEVVAITEDHCMVADDWCQRVIEAHAERPEADIIGGAVHNGSPEPLAWAAFLISNGAALHPLTSGERPIVTGHANVSFKRRALWGWGAGGLEDGRYRVALRERGGRLFVDGRIQVRHVQYFPLLDMMVYLFHGGRALAGTQRRHLSRSQWVRRLAKVVLLPLRVLVNAVRIPYRAAMHRVDYRGAAVRCAPWLLVILPSYYAGELIGHVAGPARSPWQLR